MKDIFQKINNDVYLFSKEQGDRNKNIERLFSEYKNSNFSDLDTVKSKIDTGEITNVIFAGMGSSMYALREIESKFLSNNLKVNTFEASKAAKYAKNLIDDSTLLIVVSQSGTSPEVVALLSEVKPDSNVIAITNNKESIMKQYTPMYEIFSDYEYYIAHNSYLNTLLLLDCVSNYIFDIKEEYTVEEVTRLLDIQDEYIKQHWNLDLRVFKNMDAIDIITEADNAGTGLNTTLLFREGLGLMTNTFSVNEYYHGEHLVNNKNKLTVFVDIDASEDDRSIMEDIEVVNNNTYLFVDYDTIYNEEDYAKYLLLKPVIQMSFFNRVTDYVMRDKYL